MTTHHKPNYFVSDQQGSAGNEMKPAHHKPHKPNYSGQLRAQDQDTVDIEAVGRATLAKANCDAAKMPIPTHVKALLKDVDKMSRAKANQLVPGSCP